LTIISRADLKEIQVKTATNQNGDTSKQWNTFLWLY